MDEAINYLKSVNKTLNSLTVQGYQNCAMVVGCMNDINKAITLLTTPAKIKSDGGKK